MLTKVRIGTVNDLERDCSLFGAGFSEIFIIWREYCQ